MLKIKVQDNGTNNSFSIADSAYSERNSPSVHFSGNNNELIIEENVSLGTSFINFVGSNCRVLIGEGCRFVRPNLVLNQSSEISFGNRTVWASGVMRAEHASCISLGDSCMLSADIHIRTTDGYGIFDRNTKELLNPPGDVKIGSSVWLGHGVTVNKGVVIQQGSVIGVGSIVTGFVDAFSVYAGVPARKIKENIVWSPSMEFSGVPKNLL